MKAIFKLIFKKESGNLIISYYFIFHCSWSGRLQYISSVYLLTVLV
nr:MAG TPA: hypothetical protein [Caudoviricetes sp.]